LPGIATLGVDILDVDHLVSLREVRRVVGAGVTLAGNADPVACVMRGTPDSVSAMITACMAESEGRFMVNAGCEIPAATPSANLRALCTPLAPTMTPRTTPV
jgi:uroporphyrinogen decarboxylase